MKIKEPTELLKNISKKFTKNDILALLTVLILGIINNFTFFITKGEAFDTLLTFDFNIAGSGEIALGRFGIQFVDMLRFGLLNRFLIVLICLFFLSISVIIITRIFKIENKILIFFISAIIAVSPQFTETYMYIYCADSYCLAFLLSTIAVWFIKKAETKNRYYIFTCICTIIVCSLYQAYLGVIIGLTIILLISHLLEDMKPKEVLIKLFKHMTAIFIGIVLYYIILKIILSILGMSLSPYKGANNLGIDTIISLPNSIINTYKDFFTYFFASGIINNAYWHREIINAILFTISFIGIILITIKNPKKDKYIKAAILICLILILPIGVNITNLIAPTTSITLLTGAGLITPIILVVLIYKKLQNTSIQNLIKYGYIITILILAFTFILQNTFTYMCRQSTHENYYTFCLDVYHRATQLEDYTEDKKWLFTDTLNYKPRYTNRANGFTTNTGETWGGYVGTLLNWCYFEKYLRIEIHSCSTEEYKEITKTEEFKQMPIYPNAGSVKIINNTIVVKVSDKTYY